MWTFIYNHIMIELNDHPVTLAFGHIPIAIASLWGAHRHHAGQIASFEESSCPENNGYCDGCGQHFRPEIKWFKVFHCTTCEEYALVFKCKHSGCCKHHREYFEKVPLEEYPSRIHKKCIMLHNG